MTAPSRSSVQAGRPPDPAKRAAILAAAARLFMHHGYSATSMDDIAAGAGVSKLTAYRHFKSKEGLFTAVITEKCGQMLDMAERDGDGSAEPRAALQSFGMAFMRLIFDDDARAVHRLIVAEQDRAPHLGPLFHAAAILPTTRRLAALLDRLGIVTPAPERCAADLLSLWRAKPTLEAELGLPLIAPADYAAHVAHGVEFFLRAWARPD